MQGLLATHHRIPVADVEHIWGALKSSLNTTGQTQLKQAPKPQRAWISEATLHQADCKRLAKLNSHIQHIKASGRSASPTVSLANSCGMASLAGSCTQLPSALLNGCGMSLRYSQCILPHPLLLRCWPNYPLHPPSDPSFLARDVENMGETQCISD